jgi:phosphoribosyl-ATP pyrophosphohydrolase
MVSRKSEIIDQLFEIIEARKNGNADASYTAQLISKGPAAIGRKLNEESVEALIAAAQNNPAELAQEAADVIFHLLVLLALLDVSPDEVWDILAKRQGVSGLEEKASRQSADKKEVVKGD